MIFITPSECEIDNSSFQLSLLNDPDDNRFVDCAIAGNADYMVSNDKDFRLLKEVEFPPITLLTSEEFETKFKEHFDRK